MTLSKEAFDIIRNFIREESAIEIQEGKEYLVNSRLAPIAQREKFSSVNELILSLRTKLKPAVNKAVVDALTTNETSFLRDQHPFESLTKDIMPGLIAARTATRRLRFWSAACSTGQEPYSLAMTLRESFPALEKWNIEIIATDLSKEVLEKAKLGLFKQMDIARGLPAAYIPKYFERAGVDWRIKDIIRPMIQFREMNLARPWPAMGLFDVILVRNVLIYFNESMRTDILTRASQILQKDGSLILGAAENTVGLQVPLERVTYGRSCAYRKLANGAANAA